MFPCFAGLVWYLFWQKWPPSKKIFFQPPSAHIGPILGVSIPVLDQTMKRSWLNCIIHFVPFILIKNGYFWFLFIHSYVSLFCRAGLVLILTKMASFKKNFFQPPSAHIGPILGVSIPVLDQTVKGSWLNCIIHIVPFILFKNGYYWFFYHIFLFFPVL